MNQDSFTEMRNAVQAFHERFDMAGKGGHDLKYRIALMVEELGEISAAVTKGKGKEQIAEECADLLILLLGTSIAADFDLNQSFWKKIRKVVERKSKMVEGTIRISEFEA